MAGRIDKDVYPRIISLFTQVSPVSLGLPVMSSGQPPPNMFRNIQDSISITFVVSHSIKKIDVAIGINKLHKNCECLDLILVHKV